MINGGGGRRYLRLTPSVPLLVPLVPVSTGVGGYQYFPVSSVAYIKYRIRRGYILMKQELVGERLIMMRQKLFGDSYIMFNIKPSEYFFFLCLQKNLIKPFKQRSCVFHSIYDIFCTHSNA
jgi:hypothetical protein